MTTRSFIAKEYSILLTDEVRNKLEAMQKLKSNDKLLTYSSLNRVRFLQSRLNEMKQSLERASANIDIATNIFAQKIEISLAGHNERLNRIMLALTLVTILTMPYSIIGGIMGINVQVPG